MARLLFALLLVAPLAAACGDSDELLLATTTSTQDAFVDATPAPSRP